MPGDKSVSHRAAMLAALADGTSVVSGFLASEDCLNTLAAVDALGAATEREGTRVTITGTGGVFRPPSAALDMGNSGTGMRLLAGLLAGQVFETELTGDASLCSRPMRRIQAPLESMGARVQLTGDAGTAPMRVGGAPLRAISYPLPVASAQVKSCILLAGLYAEGTTTVIEPRPTRDHTEQLLRTMGVPVTVQGLSVSVEGYGAAGPRLKAGPAAGVVGLVAAGEQDQQGGEDGEMAHRGSSSSVQPTGDRPRMSPPSASAGWRDNSCSG